MHWLYHSFIFIFTCWLLHVSAVACHLNSHWNMTNQIIPNYQYSPLKNVGVLHFDSWSHNRLFEIQTLLKSWKQTPPTYCGFWISLCANAYILRVVRLLNPWILKALRCFETSVNTCSTIQLPTHWRPGSSRDVFVANSSLIPPFSVALYACFSLLLYSISLRLLSLPSELSHNFHAAGVRTVARFVCSYPHDGCGIVINDRCVRCITQTECEAWIRFHQHNYHSMVLRVCRMLETRVLQHMPSITLRILVFVWIMYKTAIPTSKRTHYLYIIKPISWFSLRK
jgi:hypothetical protein